MNCADYDARELAKNEQLRANRYALVGGRPPQAMGTPQRLVEARQAWWTVWFGPQVPTLTETQESLVVNNQGLIRFALNGWKPPESGDLDDLFQAGQVGLIKAATTFDPDKAKFSTWAVARIRWEVLRVYKHAASVKRKGNALSLDALGEVGFDPTSGVDEAGMAIDSAFVEDVLTRAAEIDQRLPEILRRKMDGETLGEIGARFGISDQRVAQIVALARKLISA